jgi:hypothetical protein
LSSGQAIINFESMKELFCVLKVKDTPKKHWSDFSSWGIKKSIDELLLEFAQMLLSQISYLLLWMRSLQLTILFGYPFICMLFKVGNKFHFSFVREKLVCKSLECFSFDGHIWWFQY